MAYLHQSGYALLLHLAMEYSQGKNHNKPQQTNKNTKEK